MRLEEFTISWSFWLFVAISLIVLYWAIKLLEGMLERVNILGTRQKAVLEVLHIILRLFEPAAILFLIAGFIFINPFLHGLLAALVFVLAFYPVKNYINGRLFLLAHQLQNGQRIKINETSGIIRNLGRLGLSLQTQEGIRFINYTTLLSDGYLFLKGEKIGRLHQLLITPGEDIDALSATKLNNHFFSCPYIDWSVKPEIKKEEDAGENGFQAQILIRENKHLKSLTELIQEWGYGCTVLE
ncbi:MAG: hypothetical protein AB8F74_03250 [Saprospiraceae bacterium]